MNKTTYGVYKFIELAVMTDKATNRQKYHFNVSFTLLQRQNYRVQPAKPTSLFEEIGGTEKVNEAVDMFFAKVKVDPRIHTLVTDEKQQRQVVR